MDTTYTYSKANDFPGGLVNVANLENEILASNIITALRVIVVNPNGDDTDRIDIIFKDVLSASCKTLLDADISGPAGGLIAVHNNTAIEDPTSVSVESFHDKDGPEHSLRVYPAPNRLGYYRCDRDIKFKCGIVETGNDGSSFEDMKVDIATNLEVPWDEVTQVGVYKADGTLCADQADATLNGVCSVWDFHPHDQTLSQNIIPYDIKGGRLKVGTLDGDKTKHRFYSVLAPFVPGVGARVFDSYLEKDEGKIIESINLMAVSLDISQTSEMSRLRIWLYHPAGSTVEHIFSVITYRPLGTF
jgi:hypothetical protein